MPQGSFEFLQSLLFHGGDPGSIPVRDANINRFKAQQEVGRKPPISRGILTAGLKIIEQRSDILLHRERLTQREKRKQSNWLVALRRCERFVMPI